MWSSDSKGIRTIKGDVLKPLSQRGGGRPDDGALQSKTSKRSKANKNNEANRESSDTDNTALYVRGMRLPTNFGVWWDGDLLREMLDRATVSKYDWTTGKVYPIAKFDGCQFNNGTKSNPCVSADILGDWREEVVTRTDDSSELRIYVSPISTDYRINCLMEDIPYRLSVASQNVAYNQPAWTGFYLGPDSTAVEFLK